MAKKIPFQLLIGEDEVNTLGELRGHFSSRDVRTEIIRHFHSGRLASWLHEWNRTTELEKVDALREKVEVLPEGRDVDAVVFTGLLSIFLDSTQGDHPGGMEIFRKEAIHLLNTQINLLEGLLDERDVIAEKRENAKQTFTRESVPEDLEVLRGELSKLEKLDLVLALVGTMKAGKSTAINAIVGTEVLPSRNRPMTTLPTLIRHTPGTTKPVLRFENRQPVSDHASRLRDKVKELRHDLRDEMDRDRHFHDLVNSIDKGDDFKEIYEGASEIAEFLKDLNDLVRLSSRLDIKFPFDDYDGIGEMPVIEVNFAPLSEMKGRSGRLVLLDTPGPNEANQPQLRRLLREQLSKSSAVLVVLDYTQMGSDADDDVREELKKIAEVMAGRSYVLVNKFDEKDEHGDNEKQVRDLVTKDLLKGVVRSDDVFPVSARWAYLSNRARQAIELEGRLPDPKEEPWVSDFGSEAFGRQWRDRIENREDISEGADILWKDSLFTAPLERVIQSAYSRAAVLAVHSAAAKLSDYEQKMSNYVSIRSESLRKDIDDLKNQITALESDLKKVADSEKVTDERVKQLFNRKLDLVLNKCIKDAQKEIDRYFEYGMRIRIKERSAISSSEKDQELSQQFRSYFLDTEELDFDPEQISIEFKRKSNVEELIRKMNKSVNEIMIAFKDYLHVNIIKILDESESEFELIKENDITKIIQHLEERLDDADFEITIQSSDFISDFDMGILETSILVKHRIDVPWSDFLEFPLSFWPTLISWKFFDEDEYQLVTNMEDETGIDFEDVRSRINVGTKSYFSGLYEIMESIEISVNKKIDTNFKKLKSKIEYLRGDFRQSIQDHGLEKKNMECLYGILVSYQEKISDIRRRCTELRKDVDEMLTDDTDLSHRRLGE